MNTLNIGYHVRRQGLWFVVALALSGCGGDGATSGEPSANGRTVLPAPPAMANFPPGEEPLAKAAGDAIRTVEVAGPVGANANLILESFREDLAACARLIDVLRSDIRLVDQMEKVIGNADGNLERMLKGTRAYDQKDVRYLIGNQDFVRLAQSHHGDPYAAAVLENRGLFCAPTRARLQDIERLGPSAAAWTIREYFLTGSLRAVRMPWTLLDGVGVDFDELRDEVEAASRVYRGAHRTRLETWLSNAANTLRREQALAEATPDGRTREQHRDTVGEWIIMLESLRSIRIEPKSS
ncbi:MAG: hypothetical protein ACKVQT_12845 [Burkholderiales bacterium]